VLVAEVGEEIHLSMAQSHQQSVLLLTQHLPTYCARGDEPNPPGLAGWQDSQVHDGTAATPSRRGPAESRAKLNFI